LMAKTQVVSTLPTGVPNDNVVSMDDEPGAVRSRVVEHGDSAEERHQARSTLESSVDPDSREKRDERGGDGRDDLPVDSHRWANIVSRSAATRRGPSVARLLRVLFRAEVDEVRGRQAVRRA